VGVDKPGLRCQSSLRICQRVPPFVHFNPPGKGLYKRPKLLAYFQLGVNKVGSGPAEILGSYRKWSVDQQREK
jgi:hypothetical protein